MASTPGHAFVPFCLPLNVTKLNICRKNILKSNYSDIYSRMTTAFRYVNFVPPSTCQYSFNLISVVQPV